MLVPLNPEPKFQPAPGPARTTSSTPGENAEFLPNHLLPFDCPSSPHRLKYLCSDTVRGCAGLPCKQSACTYVDPGRCKQNEDGALTLARLLPNFGQDPKTISLFLGARVRAAKMTVIFKKRRRKATVKSHIEASNRNPSLLSLADIFASSAPPHRFQC